MKKADKKQAIIKYKNFIFIPSDHCRDRFDLYRASTNKKTGKGTKITIGYGYRFEEAVDKLIRLELADHHEITDIKGYVNEFKKAVNEVKNLLKT